MAEVVPYLGVGIVADVDAVACCIRHAPLQEGAHQRSGALGAAELAHNVAVAALSDLYPTCSVVITHERTILVSN